MASGTAIMASFEEFKSPFSASFDFPDTVPDQWPAPLSELQSYEKFQEVCSRLLELQINLQISSHFKVPVPYWVSLLSRSFGNPDNGDLRLTFNEKGVDESGMPLVTIRDYLLNLHDGTVAGWEGWMDSEIDDTGEVQFKMNSTAGPSIYDQDGSITVCSTMEHEKRILRREEPFASGLKASSALVNDLHYFSVVHRDEVAQLTQLLIPVK